MSVPSPRADAVRNRARVLDAARSVFADHGVNAPVTEVARRAGVGVGTIYRHFPTKEALFAAILRDDLERLVADARTRAGDPAPGDAFFALLRSLLDEGRRSTGLKDALGGSGLDVQASMADVTEDLKDAVGDLLRRAQKARAVRRDVGVPEVLALVAATFNAVQALDDAAGDKVVTVMFDGLTAR